MSEGAEGEREEEMTSEVEIEDRFGIGGSEFVRPFVPGLR